MKQKNNKGLIKAIKTTSSDLERYMDLLYLSLSKNDTEEIQNKEVFETYISFLEELDDLLEGL